MVAVAGIGSGLDIEGLVRGLVNAERAPTEARLSKREASVTNLISGFGALKSALSNLQDGLKAVASVDTYGQFKATSGNSAAVSASASTQAVAGKYEVEVTNLAQTQSLTSQTYTAATDVVGQGTITLTFGTPTYTGGSPDTYSGFTADPAKTPVTITIDETNNTLEGVRSAINEAGAGVTASLVKDGEQYRLLLTSDETGVSNSVEISVTEDGAVPGLSALAYDSTTANLTQSRAAEDAAFSVNGFALTSASNTVDNAVDGVTFTLKELTTSAAVITVSEDRDSVVSAIEKFIKGYNAYQDTFSKLTDYNADAKTRGPLQGDFSARSVASRIRNELNQQTPGITSDYNTLAAIGVTTDSNGRLSLDKDALNAALDADPDAVKALFTDTDYQGNPVEGVASRLKALTTDLLSSSGVLESRIDGLEGRIERINEARRDLDFRLEKVEARYRDQFNAMDSLLSSITSTGNFLSQQLQNLPGYYDGKK